MQGQEVFRELGLSNNEAKVYTSLVEFGNLSASEVSAKSGVSYSKIYNVLDSLVRKGLVHIIPDKTKKYGPSDPGAFITLIEEKEKKIQAARDKVKELKRFYDVKEKQPVVLAVGRKGFYKIIKEMKDGEKYAYNIKWTAEPRPDWFRSRKDARKRGVLHKELVRYDTETKDNVAQWLKVEKNIKKIGNEGVAFTVMDDCEVMIALIKSDVTLLIRDRPFAKIMKKFFEAYYECAEQITPQ